MITYSIHCTERREVALVLSDVLNHKLQEDMEAIVTYRCGDSVIWVMVQEHCAGFTMEAWESGNLLHRVRLPINRYKMGVVLEQVIGTDVTVN